MDVFPRPLQRMQIARHTSGKFDNGKSQIERTRFNIQIVRGLGSDSLIQVHQLPRWLRAGKIDDRAQIHYSEVEGLKQFRLELKRKQNHAGLSHFIAMVRTRWVVDAGEG